MNIWVPRTKIIEPNREIVIGHALKGLFRLKARRPDGRVRVDTGWFPNLILDQGLNLIGTSGNWMDSCRVGTGNTAPAVGQTNLISHVAGTSTTQGTINTGAQGSAPYYGYTQKTWRFSQGSAAGNLAEVGVGTTTSNGSNLFSRALILDGSLNPTTLTVLSDEFLDVSYELRVYVPPDDVNGTFMVSSENHDYVLRASQANSSIWSPGQTGFRGGGGINNSVAAYSGSIGAITATPGGTTASTSSSNIAYSDSTYRRDFTASWGLNEANFGGSGITAFRMGLQCGAMQFSASPGIAKDATKTFAMTFRNSWGRH